MTNKGPPDFEVIKVTDTQIETLLQCKPLPESEVRALSEKVIPSDLD